MAKLYKSSIIDNGFIIAMYHKLKKVKERINHKYVKLYICSIDDVQWLTQSCIYTHVIRIIATKCIQQCYSSWFWYKQ